MTELQNSKFRRAAAWVMGTLLVMIGIYLRCFVFLTFVPGGMLVFASLGVGIALIEYARKTNREI